MNMIFLFHSSCESTNVDLCQLHRIYFDNAFQEKGVCFLAKRL